MSDVLVRTERAVTVITLDRPAARNAMTPAMATAIGEALDAAAADDAIGAIVVTGTDPAFCAGGDLTLIARGESIHSTSHPEWGFGGMRHHMVDKPVIAAVNGPAIGGGFEMCLAADLVVASDRATFGLPEVRTGVPSNAGDAHRLARSIPRKLAVELALTGRPIDVATAARWGLVNRVVEHGALLDTVLDWAAELAELPRAAVRSAKQLAYGVGDDWADESTVFAQRGGPPRRCISY